MSEDGDDERNSGEQPDRGTYSEQPGKRHQPPGQPVPERGQPSQSTPPSEEAPHDPATDVLGEVTRTRSLEYVIGVFAAIAVGYSAGLFLFDAFADEAVGEFVLIAVLVPIFGAPMIAMVTGLATGFRLETDEQSAALASGVSTFLGFFVMLLVLVLSASIIVSGGEVDRLNDLFLEMAAFGFGVAITGATTTLIVRRFGV